MSKPAKSKKAIKPIAAATVAAKVARKAAPRQADIAEHAAERAIGDIERKLARAVVQEKTCAQVVRDLMGPAKRLAEPVVETATILEGEEMLDVAFAAEVAAEGIAENLTTSMLRLVDLTVQDEAHETYNETMDEGFSELAEENPEQVWFKRWDATIDASTCDECGELHGEVVEVDEEFSNGLDHPSPGLGEPHHNCRCFITVWIEGAEQEPVETEELAAEAA